jgi:PAN domain/Trypsin
MKNSITWIYGYAACALALAGSAGCAMEVEQAALDAVDADVVEQSLVGGTVTTTRPEVGLLNGGCTATLISPRWFITAAHCFSYGNPTSGTLNIAGTNYAISDAISIDGEWRDYDVAIGRLSTDVPANVATPATLSATHPASGDSVTVLGYGCTNRTTQAGVGTKRYVEFTWGSGNRLCPGDSGGPVRRGKLGDGGAIVAINSGYTSSGDVYGLPVRLSERIETTMRAYDWEFEVGIDRPGFDLSSIDLTSSGGLAPWVCQDRCEQEPKCRAFTYVDSNKRCFLKSALPRAVPKAGVFSGLPGMGSFDRVGRDFQTLSLSRSDECEAACARNSSCAAFTFLNGTCYLKNAVPVASTNCSGCLSSHRRIETGIDRMGSDYKNLVTASAAACATECAKDGACLAYSWLATTTRCYLKNAVPQTSVNANVTSDVRRGFEINVDRGGSDYRSFSITTPRPELCQAACEAESQCRAWTYVPPVPELSKKDANGRTIMTLPPKTDAICWLKNAIPAAAERLGMVSGRKGLTFF